jgi:hypothetical protein
VVTGAGKSRLTGICVTTTNLATHLLDEAQNTLLSPFTSNGSYTINGLAPGRYAVQFTACEGQPYASQWYRGAAGLRSAAAVKVTAGKTARGINAALTAGGAISGRVTVAAGGQPRPNICVLATDPADGSSGLALSSARGTYTIRHLSAGSYTVAYFACVSASGGLADQARTGVKVTGARTTAGVSSALGRSGSISGTVRAGHPAAPEPGVCVEATPKTGPGAAEFGISGPGGGYQIDGLAAGSYRLLFTPVCVVGTADLVPQWYDGRATAAAATPVPVTAGASRTGINATLTQDGAISGTVSDSRGLDLIGICVRAGPASGPGEPVIAITRNGRYEADGLAPGRYKVQFSSGCGLTGYATQWFSGQAAESTARQVTVAPGAITTGISAALKP